MLFSEHHSILHTSDEDWFDPLLAVDTKLFVDPFLIFQDTDLRWSKAHDRIVAHFQKAFELLAGCGCDPNALGFASAVRMLQFPEPSETCLGYTADGIRGAGSGKQFAYFIASAMCDAIGRGVIELRHFEQLGILEGGIGPDRISDITCTILKPQFIEYTQGIARTHGVPMVRHKIRAGRFDTARKGFMSAEADLPTNPVTGGPLLLVPHRFLRDLPAINADDWWEDMRSTELRDEFNADLAGRLKKKDIVRVAKRYPDKVEAWVQAREAGRVAAYDLARDPNGVYQWGSATRRYARRNPIQLVDATTYPQFVAVIDRIVERFRHFVEHSGGWRLVWDGDEEKPEEATQLVFLGIAKAYAEANNIVVDREVELGRGPVDFKFSSGFQHRALLEVKKLENGKFWNGLRAQLPSYLHSDRSRDGWLLAVRFRDSGVAKDRALSLGSEVKRTGEVLDLDLRYSLVDARPKKSASKLTAGEIDESVA